MLSAGLTRHHQMRMVLIAVSPIRTIAAMPLGGPQTVTSAPSLAKGITTPFSILGSGSNVRLSVSSSKNTCECSDGHDNPSSVELDRFSTISWVNALHLRPGRHFLSVLLQTWNGESGTSARCTPLGSRSIPVPAIDARFEQPSGYARLALIVPAPSHTNEKCAGAAIRQTRVVGSGRSSRECRLSPDAPDDPLSKASGARRPGSGDASHALHRCKSSASLD
jgi:hypothetical protein